MGVIMRPRYRIVSNGYCYVVQRRVCWLFWSDDSHLIGTRERAQRVINDRLDQDRRLGGDWRQVEP